MKTTRSLIKGELVPEYYPAFANYLARTVQAFGREGVPVSMLTIQNEPNFEPDNYPGERVDPSQRADIIGRYVGPTFKRLGLHTRGSSIGIIIGTIPKCRLPCFATRSRGNMSRGSRGIVTPATSPAQSPVHDAFPAKRRLADGMFRRRMVAELCRSARLAITNSLIIGASNNWSRGTLLWNLALDPAHGPAYRRLRGSPRRSHRKSGDGRDRSECRILRAGPRQRVSSFPVRIAFLP